MQTFRKVGKVERKVTDFKKCQWNFIEHCETLKKNRETPNTYNILDETFRNFER